MDNSKKLTVHITPRADAKLSEIVQATGSSVSAVIMEAIELYYRQGSIPSGKKPYDLARQSGIIGCLKDGAGNLSTCYKQLVSDEVLKRHGNS